MTLCICWKSSQGDYYFASDSRLTNEIINKNTKQKSYKIASDDAIKIFSIPLVIYGVLDENNKKELIYRTELGMCFAGNYINGSSFANTMSDVLSNIQAAPRYSDISIDNFINIAFEVYKIICERYILLEDGKGLSNIFIGGYCPQNNVIKIFKFNVNMDTNPISYEKKLLDFSESEIFMIGDGRYKASEVIEKVKSKYKNDYTNFHLLREIIKDESIETVGGNIQAGIFYNETFETTGVAEYEQEELEDGNYSVKFKNSFRGLGLDLSYSDLSLGDILISKMVLNPFHKERKDVYDKVKIINEKRRSKKVEEFKKKYDSNIEEEKDDLEW